MSIGSDIDEAFRSIHTILQSFAGRLDAMEAEGQGQGQLVSEPAPEQPTAPVEVSPQPVESSADWIVYRDGMVIPANAYLVVTDPVERISLEDHGGVTVQIEADVGTVFIGDCDRVNIFGVNRGERVGSVFVRPGASVDSLRLSTLDMWGAEQGEAMNLSATNILVSNVRARADRYAIWVDDSGSVLVQSCDLETLDLRNNLVESCARFVNATQVSVVNSRLRADTKHCFRVHGTTEVARLDGNSLIGGNGIMCGGTGDAIGRLEILNNRVSTTGPDGFNLKEGIVSALISSNQFWLGQGWDPVSGYAGRFTVQSNTVSYEVGGLGDPRNDEE